MMTKVLIDQININYQKYGSHGKTVLCLHGWGQNIYMMEHISVFLSDHFQVYALDFPGFGESDEPTRPFSVKDYSEILEKFCQEFAIVNPIIVAHSFGCRVALHYARNNPVLKMCLTGAAGIKDKHGIKWYFKTYTYKSLKILRKIKFIDTALTKANLKLGSSDYNNATGVMRNTLVKVVNDDVKYFLKDISVETLLVFGTNDLATPLKKGEMMEKLMPNATLVSFENDGHFAYFNQANRFNLVLKAFLEEYYE